MLTLSALDTSRLKIPFANAASRGSPPLAISICDARAESPRVKLRQSEDRQEICRVKKEVRARCEPKQQQGDIQTTLEIPEFLVPSGYSVFAIGLGLANMIATTMGSGLCVALSPIPMLCLSIHALGVPLWVGLGVGVCTTLVTLCASLWF